MPWRRLCAAGRFSTQRLRGGPPWLLGDASILSGRGGAASGVTPRSCDNLVNLDRIASWLILAQDATAKAPAKGAAQDPPALTSMLPWLIGTMVLFWLLILRPQKAKDSQFRTMVDNLKERDRVVTIGGIHGVVTNVQRDAGVITVRIDESTGTKIRVNASAIAKVITDEETAESSKTT